MEGSNYSQAKLGPDWALLQPAVTSVKISILKCIVPQQQPDNTCRLEHLSLSYFTFFSREHCVGG